MDEKSAFIHAYLEVLRNFENEMDAELLLTSAEAPPDEGLDAGGDGGGPG